jgi:hypothetical protein
MVCVVDTVGVTDDITVAVQLTVGVALCTFVLVGEEPNDIVGVPVIDTVLVGDALGGVRADCILEEIARTIP